VVLALVVAGGALGDELPSTETFRALMDAGRYAEAESVARRLLGDAEAREGAESLAMAAALDLVVEALNTAGKAGDPATREMAERALALKESHPEAGDLSLAVSLRNLGILFLKTGAYAESRPPLDRALAIREAALGAEHPDVAQSLGDLGSLLRSMGDYPAAKRLMERALGTRERAFGPEHPDVALGLTALGTMYWGAGDYAEARRYLERALVVYEKTRGPEHPMVAQVINNLAIVLGETGDLASARPYFERGLAIREKMLGPDHPDVGQSVNNLGVLSMHMQDYERARPLFERALQIRDKSLGPAHPDFAQQGLNNLAWVMMSQGDHETARSLLDRSLGILEKAVGPGHPSVAETLGRLSDLLIETGDLEEALQVTRRTRAIRERTLEPTHPYLAIVIEKEARLLALLGDPAGALDAALHAEEASREHVRLTGLTLPERQALRLAASRASGLDVALTLAAGGLDAPSRWRVWDSLIRSRAMVLDEMAARHRSVERAGSPEVAGLADRLSASRARLASLMVRGPGPEGIEKHLLLLDQARQEKEGLERDLALKSATFRRAHERGRAGLAEVVRALPPGSALLAYARYDRMPPAVAPGPGPEAGRPDAAAPGPAGLETGEGAAAGGRPDRRSAGVLSYLAFVLRSGGGDPEVVPLGPAEAIDGLVERWRREVSREPPLVPAAGRAAEGRIRPVGADLRKAIWDPVAHGLKSARQVFVVPDGVFHLVSLTGLPDSDRGYLIESAPPLHYLSAERDLVRPPSSTAGKGILVVGNPDFDASPTLSPDREETLIARASGTGDRHPAIEPYRGPAAGCAALRSEHWEGLPGSGREADEIAALWRRKGREKPSGDEPVVELSGRLAGESLVKRAAPGRRIVHLATHAFMVEDRCASALGSRAPGSVDRSSAAGGLFPLVGDNPLLLSGLVLAGANQRQEGQRDGIGEDGLLTAEEIASLDLSGVEWVVLSACETGLGKAQSGEGVLGLRRAFEIAGAGTLIMTLWRVKDEAARQWSTLLYEERLRGLSTAEAASRASLRMLRARRAEGRDTHPFHWAAFVAAGDWR
jgi:tetratricopeptide (TPR) repeat protein